LTGARKHAVQTAYNEAIEAAENAGYMQEAALCCERLGIYYLEQHCDTRQADIYLRRAFYLYSTWGAHTKCIQLKGNHDSLMGLGWGISDAGTNMGLPLDPADDSAFDKPKVEFGIVSI